MADPKYRPPPTQLSNSREHRRQLATAIQQVMSGKLNVVTDTFTLTPSAAATTLSDARLSVDGAVLFDPLTANAAAELAAGTLYATEANRDDEVWIFTHANNAQTDRDFRLLIIG